MTTHTDSTLTTQENGHGEPALLTSLGTAMRDVTARPLGDPPAWARAEVAAEIRRFTHECGPLIQQAVAVQQQLRSDPEFSKLGAREVRIGSDGRLNPGALELAGRLLQVPAVAALADSSGDSGIKGIGIITANAEVAFVKGYQAGAELVMLLPYKIGTYLTPRKIVGRAWTIQTAGLDLGYSATIVPWPLDMSFWFRPPEDTQHMVGAYITYIAPPFPAILPPLVYAGMRVEIFGWVPEKEAASPAGHRDEAFKYIWGFRVIFLEVGLHAGLGVAYQGTQVTTSGGLELATYFLNPTNIQAGLEYSADGSQGPLQGQITAPQRTDLPAKTFKTDTSTMTLSFPAWMCSAMTAAPSLDFQNDGSGGTSGWLLTSTPSAADPTYAYKWTGLDGEAWQDTIEFTIAAYSNSIPPLQGKAMCAMDGLDNVGTADIEVSFSGCDMSLSPQVFSAKGNFTLTVDPVVNAIEDFTGNVASAVLTADDSDAALNNENDFYYIQNPADPAKQLIVDYPADGTSWYAGYQFRQQDGTSNAQFRAVFWQVGKPASDANYYTGLWQALKDPTVKYTSTAYWSDGNVTSETSLAITLTPDPS